MSAQHYPLVDPSGVSLKENATILQAIATIDASEARVALILDTQEKLIGSVTDGDIRRGLLKNASLESPVKSIMNKAPHALPMGTSRERILSAMESAEIKQIPLLCDDGSIRGIITYDELLSLRSKPRSNPVVIMAGGKGRRLLPITTDIPKPMVQVGNKPILEWIIRRLQHQGFGEFHLAINYLGHVIEEHFGDGSSFGCSISYIKEKEFLGTAGALSLIEKKFNQPLVVTNGDILASVDFGDVVDHHHHSGALATVCGRSHFTEVPYGVLQTQAGQLVSIAEKPVHEDLISAGMYVLSPAALNMIPKNTMTDMPSVLTDLIKNQHKVSVYTIKDEWMDVGHHDELRQVRQMADSKAS